MKPASYLIYGVLVLGFTAMAEFRGWSLSSVNEKKVAPKTIRDNPGAYGPIYGASPRYSGGK